MLPFSKHWKSTMSISGMAGAIDFSCGTWNRPQNKKQNLAERPNVKIQRNFVLTVSVLLPLITGFSREASAQDQGVPIPAAAQAPAAPLNSALRSRGCRCAIRSCQGRHLLFRRLFFLPPGGNLRRGSGLPNLDQGVIVGGGNAQAVG
jgi:hypothetical protein